MTDMRKTPVLLRPAPMSGGVNCLTNYRRIERPNTPDGYILEVVGEGKHDVTNDFRAIMLTTLFPEAADALSFTAALDGAAEGEELNEDERASLREFFDRLKDIMDRHNAWLDAGQPYGRESH